jgi:hypothetical protein
MQMMLNWVQLSDSSCHAPSVRSAIRSLMYVILDYGQFTFVAKCLRCAPYAYGCVLLQLLVVCL